MASHFWLSICLSTKQATSNPNQWSICVQGRWLLHPRWVVTLHAIEHLESITCCLIASNHYLSITSNETQLKAVCVHMLLIFIMKMCFKIISLKLYYLFSGANDLNWQISKISYKNMKYRTHKEIYQPIHITWWWITRFWRNLVFHFWHSSRCQQTWSPMEIPVAFLVRLFHSLLAHP